MFNMVFRILPDGINFNFIRYRYFGFFISLLAIILSIYGYVNIGFNFGIDFTGGILIDVKSSENISISDIRNDMKDVGFEGFSIQNIQNESALLIKLHIKDNDKIDLLKKTLSSNPDAKIEYRRIEFVGPQVGEELREKGINAVIASLIGIYIYMLIRFNWRFACGGIIALIHDVIIVIGLYEITGMEFSLSSVAALLTIVGYSINDSVVIYDRIREKSMKYKNEESIKLVINSSINSTLSRTILTSLTTVLAAIPMAVWGSGEIKDFSLIILLGILIGTYSSIFIASPILLITGIKKSCVTKSEVGRLENV